MFKTYSIQLTRILRLASRSTRQFQKSSTGKTPSNYKDDWSLAWTCLISYKGIRSKTTQNSCEYKAPDSLDEYYKFALEKEKNMLETYRGFLKEEMPQDVECSSQTDGIVCEQCKSIQVHP